MSDRHEARGSRNCETGNGLSKRGTNSAPIKRAALIVFAPKNKGLLQFFFNFRELDAVTKRDAYKAPCTEEWLYLNNKEGGKS